MHEQGPAESWLHHCGKRTKPVKRMPAVLELHGPFGLAQGHEIEGDEFVIQTAIAVRGRLFSLSRHAARQARSLAVANASR